MRSVNVAELKNKLSKYLTYATSGEEIVIRRRNLPVAKLVPIETDDADAEEMALVAAGKLRLPKEKLDVEKFLKMPTGTVSGNQLTDALLKDREESR